MIYTPQHMDDIFKREKSSRTELCNLLAQWEFKAKDLEYSKKKELQRFIEIIDHHLDGSVDLVNMLYQLCLEERASVNRLMEKNRKMERFIRNQGFNPSDLHWVSIDEI
jgi:light-regulated signal transduction histidine kinase (bacteriophytochrome)